MKLIVKYKYILCMMIYSYFVIYLECSNNKNSFLNKFEAKNSNSNSNQILAHSLSTTKTEEKINLITGIFLKSGKLKKKQNNQRDMFSSLPREIKINQKIISLQSGEVSQKKIDLSKNKSILMHSWIKYFKYNDESSENEKSQLKIKINSIPNKFFTNREYREQLKNLPDIDYKQLDKDNEYKYVINDESFYLIVYKNIITIFSNKEVKIIYIKKYKLLLYFLIYMQYM